MFFLYRYRNAIHREKKVFKHQIENFELFLYTLLKFEIILTRIAQVIRSQNDMIFFLKHPVNLQWYQIFLSILYIVKVSLILKDYSYHIYILFLALTFFVMFYNWSYTCCHCYWIIQLIPYQYQKFVLTGLTTKRLMIWSPKAGYNTVSKCIKYPTKSYSLSSRPRKPGEWNWQQEGKV